MYIQEFFRMPKESISFYQSQDEPYNLRVPGDFPEIQAISLGLCR